MISFERDEAAGVLTVRPEGKLEDRDCQSLAQAVDPFIYKKGHLSGLIIATEKFPGWENISGMVGHMKFVRNHHRDIARVALVTDSKIAGVAESLGKHFIRATIKRFPADAVGSAKAWIAQTP